MAVRVNKLVSQFFCLALKEGHPECGSRRLCLGEMAEPLAAVIGIGCLCQEPGMPVTGAGGERGESHGHLETVGGLEMLVGVVGTADEAVELAQAAVGRGFDGGAQGGNQYLAAVWLDCRQQPSGPSAFTALNPDMVS